MEEETLTGREEKKKKREERIFLAYSIYSRGCLEANSKTEAIYKSSSYIN